MNDKKKFIFIKISNPTTADIEYTQMLIENWDNYYKPENYLLPNTEIIDTPKQAVDNWMSDDIDPRKDIERLIK